MASVANLAHGIARSPGDPKLIKSGPSSMTAVDHLSRGLGWFSFALGALEIAAPRRITKAIGLEGKEGLIRGYGFREIAAGVPTLSVDNKVGLVSRIAGDAVDLATLAPALRRSNPKRKNAMIAVGAVAAVTLLDIIAAAGSYAKHRRGSEPPRDFSDRSGFPGGASASRGLARQDFEQPSDMRAEPANAPPQRRGPTQGKDFGAADGRNQSAEYPSTEMNHAG